jgi:hypothetical protein
MQDLQRDITVLHEIAEHLFGGLHTIVDRFGGELPPVLFSTSSQISEYSLPSNRANRTSLQLGSENRSEVSSSSFAINVSISSLVATASSGVGSRLRLRVLRFLDGKIT